MKKITFILLVCVVFMLSSGCTKKNNEVSGQAVSGRGKSATESIEEPVSPGSKEEIKNRLKNYSFTRTLMTGVDEMLIPMTYKVCGGAYLQQIGDHISYHDVINEKWYELNADEKQGYDMTAGASMGYGFMVSEDPDFISDLIANEDFSKYEKTGGEKIAGRPVTKYTESISYGGAEIYSVSYWMDNEYPIICLKQVFTTHGQTGGYEVSAFTVGNVTPQNIIDLSEYAIEIRDAEYFKGWDSGSGGYDIYYGD